MILTDADNVDDVCDDMWIFTLLSSTMMTSMMLKMMIIDARDGDAVAVSVDDGCIFL